MSKRAAIYARVSTDLQRDNFSIPSQIAECRQYAQKKGYAVVGNRFVNPETGRDAASGNGNIPAFVDDYSSRELSRPGLDAAIQYLETVGYDVLVVHALDRLARDPYIRQTLEREVIARGAGVEFVIGSYEPTAEGEVRKDLDATFAKWENAKRVERCNRGKRRKAESGKFVSGRAPYGYRLDPKAFGGLAVNQQEAEIVRQIFSMYVVDGYSIREITRRLTANHIIPSLGGEKWGKSSIPKILQNNAYIGYIYYNKYIRKGKLLSVRDQGEWIRINVTPIVEDWIFEEAQTMLDENSTAKRSKPTRFYLLSGMVFCEDCGKPYAAQAQLAGRSRRVVDARSYRHRVSEGHCINRQVSAKRLEPIVWSEVVNILLDPQKLRQGYEQSLEQQEDSRYRLQAHRETLQERLVKLEKQRENLTALYIDPDIKMTKLEYLRQKERIEEEIKGIIDDIEGIDAELANIPIPADLETMEIFAAAIRERLTGNYNPSPEEKRQILELLHMRVWIRIDGSVRLSGWFEEEDESSDRLLSQTSL